MGCKICEEREKVKKKNDKYFDNIMSGLIMVSAFIVFAVAGWDSSHREFVALMFGMFGELFAGIFLIMSNISSNIKGISREQSLSHIVDYHRKTDNNDRHKHN